MQSNEVYTQVKRENCHYYEATANSKRVCVRDKYTGVCELYAVEDQAAIESSKRRACRDGSARVKGAAETAQALIRAARVSNNDERADLVKSGAGPEDYLRGLGIEELRAVVQGALVECIEKTRAMTEALDIDPPVIDLGKPLGAAYKEASWYRLYLNTRVLSRIADLRDHLELLYARLPAGTSELYNTYQDDVVERYNELRRVVARCELALRDRETYEELLRTIADTEDDDDEEEDAQAMEEVRRDEEAAEAEKSAVMAAAAEAAAKDAEAAEAADPNKVRECVCCKEMRAIIYLPVPCGHLGICGCCLARMQSYSGAEGKSVKCPVCRAAITGTHRAYF